MKRYLFWLREDRTVDFIDLKHPDFVKVQEGDNPYAKSLIIHRFFTVWSEKVSLCLDALLERGFKDPSEIEPQDHVNLLRLRLNLITGKKLVEDFPDTACFGYGVYLKDLNKKYQELQDFFDSVD